MTLVPILCLVGSFVCAVKAVTSLPRVDTESRTSVSFPHGERGCHAPIVVGEHSVRSLAD